MVIINILNDGTVVDDMSKVTVPNEIVEHMIRILERKGDKRNERKNAEKKAHEATY